MDRRHLPPGHRSWRDTKTAVIYDVTGFTDAHAAQLKRELRKVPGLGVELNGTDLQVRRNTVANADESEAFQRTVEAAIKKVAPQAVTVNVYPGPSSVS